MRETTEVGRPGYGAEMRKTHATLIFIAATGSAVAAAAAARKRTTTPPEQARTQGPEPAVASHAEAPRRFGLKAIQGAARMRVVWIAMLCVGVIGAVPWAVSGAVFTDTGSIGANAFTTGTVDISTAPSTALVTYSTMAPGDTVTDDVVVTNGGSLALRYAITSSATNTDSKALKDQLTLTIKTIDATGPGTPCDDFDGTQLYSGDLDSSAGKLVGDSAQGSNSGDRSLAAAATETLCFRVSLASSTGNAFQNATTTATFSFEAEQTANN